MNKINVTAHSGNSGTEDNSIKSLEAAVLSGADTVEFDLRFNNNGTPVMTHSLPIPSGAVSVEKAFEYLKDKNITVNIDVKEVTDLEKVKELAEKYNMWDRCFFSGVTKSFLPKVKSLFDGDKYYINLNILPVFCHFRFYARFIVNQVKKSGAFGLNCNYLNLTDIIVEECHKNNIEVSGWTANDTAVMKKLIKLNVDNITTRKPKEVIKLLK